MSKFKPTPGPWEVIKPYGNYDDLRIFSGSHFIGSIGNSDDLPEITKNNAALTASAPTIYQKLKDTVEWLEREIANIEQVADLVPYMMGLHWRLSELRDDLTETLRKIEEG